MTSRAEHYREAERLLLRVGPAVDDCSAQLLVAQAQVHATLATTSDEVAADAHSGKHRPQGEHSALCPTVATHVHGAGCSPSCPTCGGSW